MIKKVATITKDKKEVEILNPRWAKFFEEYLRTGNAYRSAMAAGFSESYAQNIIARYPEKVRQSTKEFFSTDNIKEKHEELFNASLIDKIIFPADFTDEDIKEVIEKIPGHKLLFVRDYRYGKQEESYNERYAYISVPNTMIQDKALDKVYKLRGDYAPINTVNVNLDANQLFTDEQKTKAKSAIRGYLSRRNR